MANVIIAFTATERLLSGVTVGDAYQIELDLTQYDRITDLNVNRLTTYSGLMQTSKLSSVDQYSIRTTPIIDTPAKPDAVAEFDMFIYSVEGGEQYTITDIDDNSIRQVKNSSNHSRSRMAQSTIQAFYYNWTVRTV